MLDIILSVVVIFENKMEKEKFCFGLVGILIKVIRIVFSRTVF